MEDIKQYPDFSWSYSSSSLLNRCQRVYFYRYYASHNGDNVNASDFARLAFYHKYLYKRSAIFGHFVHKAIKTFLLKVVVDKDDLIEATTDLYLSISSDLKLLETNQGKFIPIWLENPKDNILCADDFYFGQFGAQNFYPWESIKELKIKAGAVRQRILTTKPLQEFINGEILKVAEIDEQTDDKEDVFYIDFKDEKIPLFCAIDFLYFKTDGKCVVVDWKTATLNRITERTFFDAWLQLIVYALYVNQRYKIPYNKIVLRIINVVNGRMFELDGVEEWLVIKCIERIQKDISLMKSFVRNGDTKTNQSYPIQYFLKRSTTPYDKICVNCNFKYMCWGGIKADKIRRLILRKNY